MGCNCDDFGKEEKISEQIIDTKNSKNNLIQNMNVDKQNEIIVEIKEAPEDNLKKKSNIKEPDLIEKEKKLEEDMKIKNEKLINKEINLNKKEQGLNERETNLNNFQKELNLLDKQLKDDKNKLNEEKEKLNMDQKEIQKQKEKNEKIIKEKDANINKRENEIKLREKTLLENEKKYNDKEKLYQEKEKELEQREKDVIKKNQELIEQKKEVELVKKEKIKIQEKEKDLDKKIKENEIKEKDLGNKTQEIIKKIKDFETKDKNLVKKQNELSEKEKQITLSINNLKIKETHFNQKYQQFELEKKKNKENYDKLNAQLIEREKALKLKEEEIAESKKPILIGLNNIGATCYMNATLQCLSNTKKLTEYFLNIHQQIPNKNMSNEYHGVLSHIWDRKNNNKSYSPNSFKEELSKENPLFAGIQANDSKDLINFLLEKFHQELNIQKPNINNANNNMISQEDQTNEQLMLKIFLEEFQQKYNSPISNLFYGIIETKSQCLGCKIIKFNFQLFSFLEFPLQQVNEYFYKLGKRPLYLNNGQNPDVNLYECFEYYVKVDLMNGENQMYCNICNKLLDTFYSTTIYSTPIYLIINLNRGKGAAYQCKVNFPEQLNLYNNVAFKDGYTAYGLYAVICHLGPSSMSGHFVAYCRNRTDNKWYLYNDAFVNPCTKPQQYNDGMPYILFYKALTLD